MVFLIDGVRYRSVEPENENELKNAIHKNYRHVFGLDSFYFDFKSKIRSKAGVSSIPDAYVISFNKSPQWYILEFELSTHSAYDHVFPQLTKFRKAIEEGTTRRDIVDIFYDTIMTDPVLQAEIKQKIGSGEVHKFLSDLVSQQPVIIVAVDQKTPQLEEALQDFSGQLRILEFTIYQREGISEKVNAYLFEPISPFVDLPLQSKQVDRVSGSVTPPSSEHQRKTPHNLPAGLEIHNTYKGTSFTAKVTQDGKIKFGNQVYHSLSHAAVAAIQSTGTLRPTENGWRWWKYYDQKTGEEKLLDELRNKED